MKNSARKNWKKRRREFSNKISVTVEGKRVTRIRQVVSDR